MNQIGAVHEFERLAHVVIGDQDAKSAFFQSPDDFLHFVNGDRVNAAERFIEQQQLRTGHQRAGDFQSALLAAAEGVGLVFGQSRQVQFVEQVFQADLALLRIHFACLQDGQDVLFHGQLAKHRWFLG